MSQMSISLLVYPACLRSGATREHACASTDSAARGADGQQHEQHLDHPYSSRHAAAASGHRHVRSLHLPSIICVFLCHAAENYLCLWWVVSI